MKKTNTVEYVVTHIKKLAEDNFGIKNTTGDFSVVAPPYLDYDSLDKMVFIMVLEDEFGITIKEADAYCMRSLQDIINYVVNEVEKK